MHAIHSNAGELQSCIAWSHDAWLSMQACRWASIFWQPTSSRCGLCCACSSPTKACGGAVPGWYAWWRTALLCR